MIFLKHFIKSAKHTGAVAQSSDFLAKKMVRRSNLNNVETILELGPGMGSITEKIIENMPSRSQLMTFEINKEFVGYLNNKYPEAQHIHADISQLKNILKEKNIEKADVIISGIPFVSFKKEECARMLSEIESVMHENSRFVLFTYSPFKFRTFFNSFRKVDLSYVPLNIPPAYVLTLRKK